MKNISTLNLYKIALIVLSFLIYGKSTAQTDSSFLKKIPADTSKDKMNMDAVYNRPFLQMGKAPVALGGYIEGNSHYSGTDGVSEGLSFQLPRLTVFMSSTIKNRIKFLTEIEFEEGGREINIEFASMDIQINPLLNLRGGIIMNPIGSFNQNHDGPKWEFINRPVSSTTIIPSTFSNTGFGLFGKYAKKNMIYAYEIYATNGFDDRIINNNQNRTFLPATKQNTERFEESFNGVPMITAKAAVRHREIGEIGLSWMGGVYNKFIDDGLVVDQKYHINLYALDFNTKIGASGPFINSEIVMTQLEIPETFSQQFGDKQFGGFIDIVQQLWKGNILGWENSTFNIALRTEYADYNIGTFRETGGNIYDHIFAVVPGISFRPSAQTVIRFNYRNERSRDLLGNPPSITGAYQVGFSTYF